MNNKFKLFQALAIVSLTAKIALALQDPGADPADGSGWVTNAGDIENIVCANASNGSGNPNGTYYWFAATDSQSNPSYPNGGITQVTRGHTQISGAPGVAAGSGASELIAGNTVSQVLANHGYRVYAQACPSGGIANGAGCSNWILVSNQLVTTQPLPPAPFTTPASPDVNTNSISVHASVPDPQNVQYWNIGLDNVQGGSPVAVFAQTLKAYNSGTQQVTIGPTGAYNSTLSPNVRYKYVGQIDYFWTQATPATPFNPAFTTTPVQPGPSTVPSANITHCSANIIVQNSNGAPANPTYTNYQVCLNNSTGCSAPQAINGSAQPTDLVTLSFNNLAAGTTYNGNAQALNEDSAWNNSQTNGIPQFRTLDWGGTFAVTGITTTSANFVVSNIIGAGSIQSWTIKLGGVAKVSGVGDPTGTHALTGLTPDTQYNATIDLTEASGCTSTLPIGGINFTTTAADPTAFTFVANGANEVDAGWTDSLNAGGTRYIVNVCTDQAMTQNCHATAPSATKSAVITSYISSEQTYYGQVKAVSVGGGLDSNWIPVPAASATTSDKIPTINSKSCANPTGNSTTCNATGTNNGGGPNTDLKCHWTVDGGATIASGNDQLANGQGVCPQVGVNFPGNGPYNVTITVTDHQGTGLAASGTVPVNVGAQPHSVGISPSNPTIVTGNTQLFTAYVCDQFETGTCSASSTHLIAGASVGWSITGGGNLSTPSGPSTTFTATTPTGSPFTLTADAGNGVTGTTSVTVKAAGTVFDSISFIMNGTGTGGSLSVVGHDNVVHQINHNLSSIPPSGATFAPGTGTSSDGQAFTSQVTFTQSGQITLTDTSGGVQISTTVTVAQVLSRISVSPKQVTVNTLQNQVFSVAGLDQFNKPMTLSSVTWSTNGGGNVSAAGAFSSPTIGRGIRVVAVSGGKTDFAIADVINYDLSNAYAYPVPWKSTMAATRVIHFVGLGSDAKIRIYTTSGREVFSIDGQQGSWDFGVVNSSGEKLASGVYLYVIESPTQKKHGKLIVIQ